MGWWTYIGIYWNTKLYQFAIRCNVWKITAESFDSIGDPVIKVVTLPLLVAELVMSVKREFSSNLYKYLFVIPMVVPGVVMILLWRWIYDYNGLLNGFLSALGLENFMHSWLGEQATALGALVFYQFPWVAGIQFLIFLAGLQGIDTSIYEATKIDGIGPVSRIFTLIYRF